MWCFTKADNCQEISPDSWASSVGDIQLFLVIRLCNTVQELRTAQPFYPALVKETTFLVLE